MHHSADIDRYAQSISASHLFVQSNDHQAVRRGCARLRCARIPQHLRLADRQLLFLSLLLLFLLADSSAKCSTRDTLTPITTTTTTAASLLAALSEAAPSRDGHRLGGLRALRGRRHGPYFARGHGGRIQTAGGLGGARGVRRERAGGRIDDW